MRKLSSLLFFLPLLALFGFIGAQDDAEAILRASKNKLKASQDFSADFTIEIDNPAMENSVQQQGSFKYKDGMYVVKLDGQEIYCDKNKTWLYLKEINEVEVSSYDPEEAENIESIFQLYETNAAPRHEGVVRVDESRCDKIFLAIKDKSLDYNQAYLMIEQSSKLPKQVVLIDRRQTRNTYTFKQMKTNQGLSASTFRFDPKQHSGVEVINLD